MTSPVWRWAPDTALLEGTALAWLDGAIAAWSERWFAQGRIRRRGLDRSSAPGSAPHLGAGRARFETTAVQRDHLAELALDAEVGRLEMTPADRDLLDGFVETITEDLTRAIEAAVGGEAADSGLALDGASGRVGFALSDESGRLVGSLVVSRAAIALKHLEQMAPPKPGRTPLSPIGEAVAETPVRFTVHVGTASLNLTEARELGIGDVVVLDRPLDAAFDLFSIPTLEPVARVALVDPADPSTFRLVPA